MGKNNQPSAEEMVKASSEQELELARIEEEKLAEAARLEEEKKQEEARLAEELRLAEEARQKEIEDAQAEAPEIKEDSFIEVSLANLADMARVSQLFKTDKNVKFIQNNQVVFYGIQLKHKLPYTRELREAVFITERFRFARESFENCKINKLVLVK